MESPSPGKPWRGKRARVSYPPWGAASITSASGVAAKALKVGPLSPAQQATASACLNGTNQCVSFTATGARPEYGYVEGVAGTTQALALCETPALIAMRVRDMNGNPMAGASVALSQAVYAWAPPWPPHGRCSQPQLIANQTAAALSGLDGTVTFAPATIPGVATNVVGIAATGNASTLKIAVEQHP
jgi:hypothetical protein